MMKGSHLHVTFVTTNFIKVENEQSVHEKCRICEKGFIIIHCKAKNEGSY